MASEKRELVGFSRSITADDMLVGYRRHVRHVVLGGPCTSGGRPIRAGVLPLDGLRVTRSLRKSMRRFDVVIDADFPAVLAACADPERPGRLDRSRTHRGVPGTSPARLRPQRRGA